MNILSNITSILSKKPSLAPVSVIPKTFLVRRWMQEEDEETLELYKLVTVVNSSGFLSINPYNLLDCYLLYYDIHLRNLNQSGTRNCKVLKLQFMSFSLKSKDYKSWLYHFFNSHLQTNTCTSKQVLCFHVPTLLSRRAQQAAHAYVKTTERPSQEELSSVLRFILFPFSIYSLLLCSCNMDGFNPTQVLSVCCLYQVY